MIPRLSLVLCFALAACGTTTTPSVKEPPPSFTLAVSEYPSWVTFQVAGDVGLIDVEKGKLGPIEEHWDVDLVVNGYDYEMCMTLFAQGAVDAATITNTDAVQLAAGRDTVAVFPTSNSFGADKLIATSKVASLQAAKGKTVYGLEKSVSEYLFWRLMNLNNLAGQVTFTSMGAPTAAQNFQQGDENVQIIAVWNPYALESLEKVENSHDIGNSTAIEGEIVDMAIAGADVMRRPGADRFALAMLDTQFAVIDLINDPDTRVATLEAMGSKYGTRLTAEAMGRLILETRLYQTPEEMFAVFTGTDFQQRVMPLIVEWNMVRGNITVEPLLAFGTVPPAPEKTVSTLVFDPTYAQRIPGQRYQAPPAK